MTRDIASEITRVAATDAAEVESESKSKAFGIENQYFGINPLPHMTGEETKV